LTAYKLKTEQTTSGLNRLIGSGTTLYRAYVGIRVWKRLADGTEIEITEGTPVAIASRIVVTSAIHSATWSCPETSLTTTDAIVVRVYGKWGGGDWHLLETFITEQLGATKLDAAIWTVYYYISITRYIDPETGETWYYAYWWFGSSTHNSRIENFSWSIIVKLPTNMTLSVTPL